MRGRERADASAASVLTGPNLPVVEEGDDRDAAEELERPIPALAFSALFAGATLGFSGLAATTATSLAGGSSGAELVLIGTPIDLRRLIDFDVPALRVTYRLEELGEPTLEDILREHGLIGDKALV